MGREVCTAVLRANDLELAAGVDPAGDGGVVEALLPEAPGFAAGSDLQTFLDVGVEVAVDFTRPEAVLENVRWCVQRGIHIVVGTTGVTPEGLDEMRSLAGGGEANVFIAPNFAVGAVLMMRFAEQAARYLDASEVIELHHDGKLDAPSGTAITTARRIAAARGGTWSAPGGDDAYPGARGVDVDGVRIHSVRLPGLLAHQQVVFGAPGETLSIRHDSTDRASFMPGVLMAIRAISDLRGLTIGLDALLHEV
jgi:4-hydroxy-tetrahydrodipicolinate reductase